MTLSPRTMARSIFRWDWLSCVSSALRRTRFMCGSNPSRIPRYPRPPFSSTITFELIRWLRRESGLIIGPRRCHGGGVLKGLREDDAHLMIYFRGHTVSSLPPSRAFASLTPLDFARVPLVRIHEESRVSKDVHPHDHMVTHVLAIGHSDGDVEFAARDDDLRRHDVAFLGFVRRGSPDAHAVHHGAQACLSDEVRVEGRPGRARIDPREDREAPLRANDRDLLDHTDHGSLLHRVRRHGHRLHPSLRSC